MSAFQELTSAAKAQVFAHLGEDAAYLASDGQGGFADPVPVRVRYGRDEQEFSVGSVRTVFNDRHLRVLVADLPDIAEGDRFEIRGRLVKVLGKPMSDGQGDQWTCEIVPVAG